MVLVLAMLAGGAAGAGDTEGVEAERVAPAGLAARRAAFEALRLDGAPGRPREEAEEEFRAQLVAKVRALQGLEAEAGAVQGDARGEALVVLAEACLHMADALEGAWVPTWLTPDQVEIYRMELADKAYAQRVKALRALDAAKASGSTDASVTARIATLDARLPGLRARLPPPRVGPGPTIRALESQVKALETVLARQPPCLPAEQAEEVRALVELARPVIAEQDISMAQDMRAIVDEVLARAEGTCG